MRQAYINHQPIDLDAQDNLHLYFNSPLLQDISTIQSNRTTTYTIPRTQRNLNSIGLAHIPQVEAQFPYQLHTFAEYRDGLPLIQAGICQLLSINPTHIELSVTWGNKANINLLQDLYIHQIPNTTALPWLNASYLQAHEAHTQPYGWLLYDSGKGTHIQYLQPALAVTHILHEIERTTGLHIRYPTGTFDKAWIPTISKKPAAANQEAYTIRGGGYNLLSYASAGNKDNSTLLRYHTFTGQDPKAMIATYRNPNTSTEVSRAAITVKRAATIHIQLAMQIHDTNPPLLHGDIAPLTIRIAILGQDTPSDLYLHFPNQSTQPRTALYNVQIDKEIEISTLSYTHEPSQLVAYCYYNLQGTAMSLNRPTEVQATDTSYQVGILYHELSYTEGDVFPLFNNLPPLSCIDFIKALLHLYGLYAYYDVQQENTILLQPIEDIYTHKALAIDYTSRLCSIEQITHRLPNFAQQNAFLYLHDPTVSTSANGELLVQHQALAPYRKLVEIPFAPSDTTYYTPPSQVVTDPNQQAPSPVPIAYIPFYNADGYQQSIKPRIVNSCHIQLAATADTDQQTILAAVFDDTLHFDQHKPQGILATKYKAYSRILAQPILLEVQLNLSLLDVLIYSEIRPLFLAGRYYMPIRLEVEASGLATCTLLQLPPEE